MSIEKILAELIAAINMNTAALTASAGASPKADKPAKVKDAATTVVSSAAPAPAPASAPAATAASPTPSNTSAPAAPSPAYTALADLFLKVVQVKGRDAALAIIAPLPALNAIKAGEQMPGQYAALSTKLSAALAEPAATSLV